MLDRRQVLASYLVALAATAAAVLARWLLNPAVGHRLPYITLFGATALTVWFGGWRPAVVSVLLGYLATVLLFIETEPGTPLSVGRSGGIVGLAIYLAISAIIIGFGEAARRARRKAETSRRSILEHHQRLEQERARRQDAEELFHRLVEEVRDYAIVMLDLEGLVVSWNAGAERIFGYRAEEIIGQHFSRFYPEQAMQSGLAVQGLDTVRAKEQWEDAGWQVRKDGSRFWANVVVSTVHNRAGDLCGFSAVTRDLTEQRKTTETLRSIVDHVLDGIITIDELGNIQSFNRAAETLFGYQSAEVIGQNVRVLMPEPYHGEHDQYIGNYLRTGEAKIIGKGREVTGRRKDGSTFPMDLAVSTFQLDQVRLFTGIVRDVTERKHYEREREQADRRKDQFLATLAHELRNPLAPIRNAVQVLQAKGPPDPDLSWCRGVIERQVGNMARLLDDLLDISRITHDKLELRKERTELASVIHAAVETSRPLIHSSGQTLAVTLPEDPVFLDADPVRLGQVFSNLLNNAARYGVPGGHIGVTGIRQGTDVVVSIKDDGIGIAREILPRVFEIFSQADTDQGRLQGGLGIGLSLARGLVELHGGYITVQSDGPGQGSEFIVRLPVAAASPAATTAVSGGDEAANGLRKRRLLIVDDIQDSADSLAMLLEMRGHEVHTAYDGQQALVKAERFRPEVVLLDIGMPLLDGYEACRRIRARPWGQDVHLIALTGWGQVHDRRRTEEAGFDRHLVKPVSAQELLDLLDALPPERRGSSIAERSAGDGRRPS